eukprot:TRINITY_DN12407_c0_g1_i3.p1 TRINITY_DN12407_c0_g1~~TRINITY_DN12407_c0_g1_i3.p1  ORF type:complete len:141 (-),score=6.76 TRINITY_DN12407_c0_g1_i3:504-926(-)
MCMEYGAPKEVPICTKYYSVSPGETCTSIIFSQFDADAASFFDVNPGMNCQLLVLSLSQSDLSSDEGFGQQVCLKSTTQGSILGKCKSPNKVFTVPRGMTGLTLLKEHYQGKQSVFKALNNKAPCPLKPLRLGAKYCYKP